MTFILYATVLAHDVHENDRIFTAADFSRYARSLFCILLACLPSARVEIALCGKPFPWEGDAEAVM